jgi:ABC-type transporter Mla subunit MlaD
MRTIVNDKEEIVEMLATAADLVEGLDGNEDALTRAIDYIEKAIELVNKYATE